MSSYNINELHRRLVSGGECSEEEALFIIEKYPKLMSLLNIKYFTESYLGDFNAELIIKNIPPDGLSKIFSQPNTEKLAYEVIQLNSKLYQSIGLNRLDANILRYMLFLHVEDAMVYQTSLTNEEYRILINSILDFFNAPRSNMKSWAVVVKDGDSPNGMGGILYSVNGTTRYKKLGPAFRYIAYEYQRRCKPLMNGDKNHDLKVFFNEMLKETNERKGAIQSNKERLKFLNYKKKLFHRYA